MLRSRKDPELAKRIGARIRQLRDAEGITQETLAWDCVLDRGYVGHIEAGRKLPSLTVLALIGKRLDADLLDIVSAAVDEDRAELLEAVRKIDRAAADSALRKLGL